MKFVSKYSRMRPMFYYSKPINNLITNKQNKYEIIQTIEDKERDMINFNQYAQYGKKNNLSYNKNEVSFKIF